MPDNIPAQTFEISLNYTKLAASPTKSCAGKSKINSAKKEKEKKAFSGDRTQDPL